MTRIMTESNARVTLSNDCEEPQDGLAVGTVALQQIKVTCLCVSSDRWPFLNHLKYFKFKTEEFSGINQLK